MYFCSHMKQLAPSKQLLYQQAHLGMWDLRRLASVDSKSLNMVQDAQQTHWNV